MQGEEALHYYIEQLMQLEKAGEEEKKNFITTSWMNMDRDERFVFNKLITGAFRIGVSQKIMVNALAKTVNLESTPLHIVSVATGIHPPLLFDELLSADTTRCIQNLILFTWRMHWKQILHELGDPDEWQAEWKWDGIRGQIIKRNNESFCMEPWRRIDDGKISGVSFIEGSVTGWHCTGWRDHALC